MVSQRIHKSFSWNPLTQAKSSPFAPHPFVVQAQHDLHKAPTQEEIENEAFNQNKFEAFGLQRKKESGTITPVEQERLGVLQAQMDDFWAQRLERASQLDRNFANIPVHAADNQVLASVQPHFAIQPYRDGVPPQSPQQTIASARKGEQGGAQRAFLEINPQSYQMPPIQAKLTIGQANDRYEQEADWVASQVVQKINAPVPAQPTQEQSVQRQEEPKEPKEKLRDKPNILPLQRSSLERQKAIVPEEASTDLASAINIARGGGQPLDASLQRSMGRTMGADFSGVRVHTDARSDQLNRSIQARAFTTGQDVFFRQGEYDPGSRGGQELIAHELTHVVQQSGGAISSEEKSDNKLINLVENTGHERVSPKNGKGSDVPEKAKGEDYANNVQKLIDDLNQLLVGFSNEAIDQALATINEKRPICSVSTSKVKGEDTNTAAYGTLKDGIVRAVSERQYLLQETDRKHFVEEVKSLFDIVNRLIAQIPTIAVDTRVAEVIASEGKKEQKQAQSDIDAALLKLSQEMQKRLKDYFKVLFEKNFPSKKDNEPKGPPPGGGAGGGILVS